MPNRRGGDGELRTRSVTSEQGTLPYFKTQIRILSKRRWRRQGRNIQHWERSRRRGKQTERASGRAARRRRANFRPSAAERPTARARRVDNKSGGTRPHSPRARRPKSPKMSREATRIRGGRERRFRNPQNADRRGEICRLQMAVAVWPPAPARPRRLRRRRHPARSKSRRFALCGIDRIDVIKKSSEWAEYQNNLGFMRRRDSS